MTRPRSRRRFGKPLGRLISLVSAYLLLTCLGHHLLWPEAAPAATEMPQDGDVLVNRIAGERITFVQARRSSSADAVVLAVELQPGGAIPYPHVHGGTLETFEVAEGELTMRVDGVDHHLKAGQHLAVEPGLSHQPRNDSGKPVRVKVTLDPNANLDLCLVQLHSFMDDPERTKNPLTMGLQMVALSDAYDVQLPMVPVWMQRAATFLAAPTARLLGYRSWQADYLAHAHERGIAATNAVVDPAAEVKPTGLKGGS